MKSILKYCLTFLFVLLLLLTFLVVTAKIPRKAIQENIKESTQDFHTRFEVEEVVKRRDYTFKHPYADAMLLNIIYCVDTSKPLESVLEAKYYVENIEVPEIVSYQLDELVDNELEGNVSYLRYWHGSMGVVRILLLILHLEQIYILHAIILSVLAILLIIILIKKKAFALIGALVVASIMCAVNVVPFCLEYTWMFYIMLIASILAILWKDKPKRLNMLFFITGMITCFFDFLTTELITLLIPVIIVLVLNTKENKITSVKQAFLFVVQACFLWGISYVSMWIAKWLLAYVVLNADIVETCLKKASIRVNGEVIGTTPQNLPWKAIIKNLVALYPLNIQKTIKKLAFIPVTMLIVEIILIRKKGLKKLWLSGMLLLIGLLPYVRYFLLANHSYRHYFFTFRSQIITVTAIILAMIYSIDFEYWKKIERKDKKKNGTNHINSSTE